MRKQGWTFSVSQAEWNRCVKLRRESEWAPFFSSHVYIKMKRLTYKKRDGSAAQRDSASLTELVVALFEYEEIGLEPDEIKRRLCTFSSFLEKSTQGKLVDTRYSLDDILDCCETKEGEWVMVKDENGMFRNKCSMCGTQIGQKERKTPYCPECGARMSGLR